MLDVLKIVCKIELLLDVVVDILGLVIPADKSRTI